MSSFDTSPSEMETADDLWIEPEEYEEPGLTSFMIDQIKRITPSPIAECKVMKPVSQHWLDYTLAPKSKRRAIRRFWILALISSSIVIISLRKLPKLFFRRGILESRGDIRSTFAFSHNDEMQGDDALVSLRQSLDPSCRTQADEPT